jgi:hypothetical protein
MNIMHRPGRIHSNVDILSRPVLDVNLVAFNNVEAENSLEKTLDVYENEPLLFFIKNGKHLSGVSSNVIRRINKLIPNYKFKNNVISFRKNESENWRVIPKPEERVDLINKAHLIGHFQVQSTYERLKPDYYWKKMKGPTS